MNQLLTWIIHYLFQILAESRKTNGYLKDIAAGIGPPPRSIDQVAWHHDPPRPEG